MEARSRRPSSRLWPELRGLPRLTDRLLVRTLALASAPWIERVEGPALSAIPDPAVFALSHNNTFECLAVPPWLFCERDGRPLHFLIDWMYLEIPVVGGLIRRFDPIAVFTKKARFRLFEDYRLKRREHSPIEAALQCLAAGRSVALFPEGRRNRGAEQLLRGRPGLGQLILGSAAPVVPIGIDFPARDRLGRVPRAGRLRVRVGEPLSFEGERAEARRLLGGSRPPLKPSAEVSDLSRRTVDQVMTSLSALSGKRKAQSISPRPNPEGRIREATRDFDRQDRAPERSRGRDRSDLRRVPAREALDP